MTADDPARKGDGAEADRRGAPHPVASGGHHGLDRLHARSDRSARRGLVVLLLVLAGLLVVIVVGIRTARQEEADEERGRDEARAETPPVAAPPPIERRKMGLVVAAEGRLFWPTAPEKGRGEGDEIWDGEGIAAAADGGAVVRFFAGGRVELAPGTHLHLGDGRDRHLAVEHGFLALEFARDLPEGLILLDDAASLRAAPDSRIVIVLDEARPDRPRTLHLHGRRGRTTVTIAGRDEVLEAGRSLAFLLGGAGPERTVLARVELARDEGGSRLEVREGERRIELASAHLLQPLRPETRVLLRDLRDQARALEDGGPIGVDLRLYLREKGALPDEIALLGGDPGDVEATVRLVRGGETLIETSLAALFEKDLGVDRARLDRLLGARLLPVTGGEGAQTVMELKIERRVLELFARNDVKIPEAYLDRSVVLAPNIVGHPELTMQAIARALGCVLVEAGDYGLELVPESD